MALTPRNNLAWLWLTVLVIAADQASKFWIIRQIARFDSVALMPHLNLVHLQNTGAAFSMMNTAPATIFIGLSFAVTLGMLVWLFMHQRDHALVAASFSLIMGGAVGNAIDRLRAGYVTDFIDFYWNDWHFAAFNVADSAITVGAGLLILDLLLENRRQQQARKSAS